MSPGTSRYEIAYWWYRHRRFVIDLGEPACFACSWYSERWPIVTPGAGAQELRRLWDKAEGLERCHLVPAAHGGEDHPQNLVLLCHECHLAAPNYTAWRPMLEWIERQPNWFVAYFEAVIHELEALGADLAALKPLSPEAMQLEVERTGRHFGQKRMNPATMATVIYRASTRRRLGPVRRDVPDPEELADQAVITTVQDDEPEEQAPAEPASASDDRWMDAIRAVWGPSEGAEKPL